ncbi:MULTISPECIES: hypothetical protein [Acidobacteriaceae]|uniref:hypothetical protein n=1 Tax=Acidobacteriaceae TaxID=204434 RepID=UPI00131C11FA|nr:MULTISPECIES: hypothetical protein [Acidobacteriaceae]MDW5265930.1 hypothetical protein [Edaphobacter sp.]
MKVQNRNLYRLGMILVLFSVTACIMGCSAPSFLTDLEMIVPIAGSAVAGLLALLSSVTGSGASAAASIQSIVTKVDGEFTDLNQLIASYKTNPADSTLENIEVAVNEVVTDLKQILDIAGLPDTTSTKVNAVVQEVVGQLEAMLSVIPVLKSSTAGQTLTQVVKPVAAATFKANIHGILGAK